MLRVCLLIITLMFSIMVCAEELGRLFTTPEQRAELDALRYQKELVHVDLPIEPNESGETADEETIEKENLVPIRLKGLIYRKEGKSSAWINDAMTRQGDLELQDIDIDENDISPDQVLITLPGINKKIQLKVGQQYIPTNEKKIDLLPEENGRSIQ